MRIRPLARSLAALSFALISCGKDGPMAPDLTTRQIGDAGLEAPPVRISEIHYDNASGDVGEAIEISGPAGTDLTGWRIVLYNGSGGAVYTPTFTLAGAIPAVCGARGVIVQFYATNGIQNGNPDGIALVDAANNVIEFLSYGGTFTAVGGPAAGMLSTNIGVSEGSSTPIGHSLQRNADGSWTAPAANTFGVCNDDGEVEPPAEAVSATVSPDSATIETGTTAALTATALDADNAPVPSEVFTWSSADPEIATVSPTGVVTGVAVGIARIAATGSSAAVTDTAIITVIAASAPPTPFLVVSEINYDPTGTDTGEAIEVLGLAGFSVAGWQIVLYNGNGGAVYSTVSLAGTIPDNCGGLGVVVHTYPTNGIQNGSPDAIALVNNGTVFEFLSYEGTVTAVGGPADGMTSVDIGVSQENSPTGRSLQRAPSGPWYGPNDNSFGECNGEAPPPPANTIAIFGRAATDPPVPVGYQIQLFGNLLDGNGDAVSDAVMTWTSDTPTLATVDERGVVTALGAGAAVIRATAHEGTTNTFDLPTVVATPSATASYIGNAEFGEPTDGNPSDDYVIRYPQYTSSFNGQKGIPNWVAYEIEATHFGAADRCNCFTYDNDLPAAFTRYTTADYTGAGTHPGAPITGGIDRGHLARSADRTAGNLDNARTYLFTNIIPQAADMNQGPWANFETTLGNLARDNNKEVYVIAGATGNKGTVKDEGKIVIPEWAWKVAVIVDRDVRLADITSETQMEVRAVVMPNIGGIRNTTVETFYVTVDSIESLSGYDVLALLRDDIEVLVESGTARPVAAHNGPFATNEGSAVALSAAGSSDADGDVPAIVWHFGDGNTASGIAVNHTYGQDGAYAVMVIATDVLGIADTTYTVAVIANVAPAVTALRDTSIIVGETYVDAGSFTDPGNDSWSGAVNYGDGSASQPVVLGGMSFSLSHLYGSAGTFTATLGVSDDDVTTNRTATVTVIGLGAAILQARALVDALVASGAVSAKQAKSMYAKLNAAGTAINRGNTSAAKGLLRALRLELGVMVLLRRLTVAEAAPLAKFTARLIDVL